MPLSHDGLCARIVGDVVAAQPVRLNPIAPESRIIDKRTDIIGLPSPLILFSWRAVLEPLTISNRPRQESRQSALLPLSAIQTAKRAKSLHFAEMLKQEVWKVLRNFPARNTVPTGMLTLSGGRVARKCGNHLGFRSFRLRE